MENTKIVINNHKQLEELLSHEEYRIQPYYKMRVGIESKLEDINSGWLPPEKMSLFEDMEVELGRIPSQKEYLKEYIKATKEHTAMRAKMYREGFVKDGVEHYKPTPDHHHIYDWGGHVDYPWDEVVENYFKYRATNFYISFVAEISARLHIQDLYPRSIIYSGGNLDTMFKVDHAVQFPDEGLTLYFHVTNYNSKYPHSAKSSVRNKAERKSKGYPVGMHKDNFTGDWVASGYSSKKARANYRQNSPSHIILPYQKMFHADERVHWSTMDVNGNRLYSRDYLKELIDASLEGKTLDGSRHWNTRLSNIKNTPEHNLEYMLQHENLEENELKYFIQWMVDEKRDLSGIRYHTKQPIRSIPLVKSIIQR